MIEARTADVVAIEQLLARATQELDAGRGEGYVACFAPNGVLELDERHEGHGGIHAWLNRGSPFAAPEGGSPGFVSHHLTTCRIDFTGPETATARTYWLVTSAAGLDHNGYYVDDLRRIAGEWRLAHRRPRTLWINPESVIHR